MQRICDKLKSKAGTSLILALVFMLVCAFVGAVVLASSTANVGRTEKLIADNQDYLSQRSAANLLLDAMFDKGLSGNGDIVLECTEVKGADGSLQQLKFAAAGDNSTEKMTELRRVIYETAVWGYMDANELNANPTIENFIYQSGVNARTTDNFQVKSAPATLSLSDPADASKEITARIRFSDKGDNSLIIDFGEDSKISVVIKARVFSEPSGSGSITRSITWSRTRADIVKGAVK